MLAFILYLMIAPCGLKGGRVLFCPVTSPAISAIPGERLVIEDEIAALQRELVLLDRSCQPTIPIVPGATEPEKIPDAPKKAAPETPPELPSFPTPETVPLPKQAPADDPGDDAGLQPDDVAQQIVDRGAKRGALNFALSWKSTDDIDLSVTCPTGQIITYTNRSACGGTYDLDANVTRAEAVADPVENVVFDDVTEGDYQVRAHLKGSRTAGEKEVTLHVLRQDGRNQTYSGKVSGASPVWSVNISISR